MTTKTNSEISDELANELYDRTRDLSVEVILRAVPAPELYHILGNLKWSGGCFLQELLARLSQGLEESMSTYDVYDNDRDPATSIAMARDHLDQAAALAATIAHHLEKAQSAIASQGHHGRLAEEEAR